VLCSRFLCLARLGRRGHAADEELGEDRAIFRRALKLYDLPGNPVAEVDRFRVRSSGDIQVFSPEEIWRWFGPLPRRRTRRSS
jgi:hypothetical protein